MSSRKNVKGGFPQKAYNSRLARGSSQIQAFRQQVRSHNATFPRRLTSFEKKNIDQTVSFPTFATATSARTTLNASQAGALPTNRVGRRIKMTSLLIRGNIQMAATSTGSTPVRVLVVYDKQTNKAAPAANEVLNADTIANTQLLANSHRFQVIMDEIVQCVGASGPQSCYINRYVKLNGLETEYIDGTGAGTSADITSGGLFCFVWTSAGIGVAALTNELVSRVRFVDA